MSTSTPSRASRWTDHDVEQFIGNLLRVGVLVSATVTAIGGTVLLLQHGLSHADYRVFSSEPAQLRSVQGILVGAAHLQSHALVQLGVLLLIATPIVRVALSLVAFALQRDRLYVAVTAVVLAVLLFSLLFSHHA
jgi:uncharacterized membrane protein